MYHCYIRARGGSMRLSIVIFLAVITTGCATPQQSQQATIPPNPELGCIEAIVSRADFALIRSKIYLASAKDQPFAMMTNTDKPTEEEKKEIAAWISARQECFNNADSWYQQYSHPQLNAIVRRYTLMFFTLTADLYNGKITYGDYANGRSQIYVHLQSDIAVIIQHLNEQQAAANEQNKNRALMYLLNQPKPYQAPAPSYYPVQPMTTTNCNVIGNQMNCTTR